MSHPFFLVIGRDCDLGVFPGNTEEEAIAAYLAEAGAVDADDELTARRAVGRAAIRAAQNTLGVTLCKHADPVDLQRREVSIDEAEEIAAVDVSLIYAVA
jgi:hypothetical protein